MPSTLPTTEPLAAVTTAMASTEKNPQMDRLQAVNQHLRLALDQVQDGVLLLEPSPLEAPGPRIAYANAAMARLTGRAPGSLQKQPVGNLIPGEKLAEFLGGFDQGTAEGKVWHLRGSLCKEGGEVLAMDWTLTSTRDAQGRILNFIATARPAAPQQAPAASAAVGGPVKILSSSKDDLPEPENYHGDQVDNVRETARRVAHEFNNALTAISLPLEWAVQVAGANGALLDKLHLAQHSASNAACLAKDFLDCFRPRAAARTKTDLLKLLQRALRLATVSDHVRWELDGPENLFYAEVDQEQIERVVFNLVRNACDAMNHKGSLTVLAQNHSGVNGQNYVGISIRDFGPGIPEEHLKHLFHSRFTTKANGNGCGLPICYQIIKDHGGEIVVNTKIGNGTAFTLYLPAMADQTPLTEPTHTIQITKAPEPPAAATTNVSTAPARQRRVLIVDDEQVICLLAGEVCKHLGYAVDTVSEGGQALQLIANTHGTPDQVDGVLMDINLRGTMNGVETLQAMRRLMPNLAVVATSGEHHSDEHYRQFGFNGFLPKPYKMDNLKAVLRGLVG